MKHYLIHIIYSAIILPCGASWRCLSVFSGSRSFAFSACPTWTVVFLFPAPATRNEYLSQSIHCCLGHFEICCLSFLFRLGTHLHRHEKGFQSIGADMPQFHTWYKNHFQSIWQYRKVPRITAFFILFCVGGGGVGVERGRNDTMFQKKLSPTYCNVIRFTLKTCNASTRIHVRYRNKNCCIYCKRQDVRS